MNIIDKIVTKVKKNKNKNKNDCTYALCLIFNIYSTKVFCYCASIRS